MAAVEMGEEPPALSREAARTMEQRLQPDARATTTLTLRHVRMCHPMNAYLVGSQYGCPVASSAVASPIQDSDAAGIAAALVGELTAEVDQAGASGTAGDSREVFPAGIVEKSSFQMTAKTEMDPPDPRELREGTPSLYPPEQVYSRGS